MPDLLTHVIVGLILAKLFKVKKKSLVIFGAILPDIVYKLKLLSFFFYIPENPFLFGLLPFHSPVGLIIVTILLSFLFNYPKYKTMALISLGWVSHILLDLTNKHYLIKQTYLLMPFSYNAFEFGWFWMNEYLIMLLSSIAVLAIIYILENIAGKRKANKEVKNRSK